MSQKQIVARFGNQDHSSAGHLLAKEVEVRAAHLLLLIE